MALLFLTPALLGTAEETNSRPPDLAAFGAIPVAAAIGRSIPVGGWDVHRHGPKPILRAVPAGSVYFYRLDRPERFGEVARALHGTCISDLFPEAGFGLAAIGGWNHVR
jgi:CRISPR-associated protein Cmr3